MNHRLTLTAAAATLLTSVALYPLVRSATWFWEGAGAIAVVAAVGTATRLRHLPALACLGAGLAGLLLYLNIVFSGQESPARVVPDRESLHHLWWLAHQAMSQTSRFAPPVPATRAVLLLAVLGIGLTAVATDLIVVRLRRPAIAGLALLALFSVPLATTAHQGAIGATLAFCLAMAGYLAILAADGRDRLRLWGRLVSAWNDGGREAVKDDTPDTRKMAASGRRVGLAAVVLALFIPLIVPGSGVHGLFAGHGGAHGPGSAPLQLPQPLDQMNSDLRKVSASPVLTYHTADLEPPYLQVYVLADLTPDGWQMNQPVSSAPVGATVLPRPQGLGTQTAATEFRETVHLSPRLGHGPAASYLPLPYPARFIHVAGDWRIDRPTLTMFSAGAELGGLSYTVTGEELSPSDQRLSAAAPPPPGISRGYLSVPAAFRPLAGLARKETKGQSTAYGRAIALQRWFTTTGGFRYTLAVGTQNTPGALIRFLTSGKRGYCQQFAFGMAVLARLLGIPSRVAIGYTQGSPAGRDTWLVRTSDAHAWPELYFQGTGWIRFEPTPAGADGQGQATATAPAYSIPPPGGIIGPDPGATSPGRTPATPGTSRTPAGGTGHLKAPGSSQGGGTARASHSSLPAGLIAAIVAGLALITPRSARSLTRRRRWLLAGGHAAQAHAAWRELRDDLIDHRITCPASESPRAVARRLGEQLALNPGEREALSRIAVAEERARYAREPASAATLRSDVRIVRQGVARAAGRPARWYARVLPSSVLHPARTGLQHALDVFGWLDRLASLRVRGSSSRVP